MSDYITTFDASIARNLSAQYREDSYEHDIQDVFVEINNACHNGDNCVFFRKYICKDAINKLRALGYSVQYDQKDGGFNIWWQFAGKRVIFMKITQIDKSLETIKSLDTKEYNKVYFLALDNNNGFNTYVFKSKRLDVLMFRELDYYLNNPHYILIKIEMVESE